MEAVDIRSQAPEVPGDSLRSIVTRFGQSDNDVSGPRFKVFQCLISSGVTRT